MSLSSVCKLFLASFLAITFSASASYDVAYGEVGDRVNSTVSSKPERLDREPTPQEIEKSVAKYKTYYVSYFPGRATKDDKDAAAKKQSEGDEEKGRGIKRRFTSAYDPHRKEAILVPQLVGDGDEIGKGKKDNEAVTKLELSEISTLCIPGCDPEKDPVEQAVCVIIDTKTGKRYDFSCGKDKKNFKKNGFVGTVQLAIDVSLGRAPGGYMDYKVTEVIAYEGKVEKQNLAVTYDPEAIDPVTGKQGKYVKYPHSAHYIGSTSPKDQNPNREKSDPCGFIHGYCFDPYAGDWWDNPGADTQRYGPCNDAVPHAGPAPGEIPHELVTDNNRIAWTTPIGIEEPEDHV